jgi:hypothetical protein
MFQIISKSENKRKEVDLPSVKNNEVLIRNYATTVTIVEIGKDVSLFKPYLVLSFLKSSTGRYSLIKIYLK